MESGAQISLVPPTPHERRFDKPLTWGFTIADVKHPLLGADFLAHYGLAPDLSRGLLIDLSNFTIIRGGLTTA